MAAFRESVAASYLYKFFIAASLELREELFSRDGDGSDTAVFLPAAPAIAPELVSAVAPEPRPITCGTQMFDLPLSAAEAAGLVPPSAVSTPLAATAPDAGACVDVASATNLPGLPDTTRATTGPEDGGSVGKPLMHASGLYQVRPRMRGCLRAQCCFFVAGVAGVYHCEWRPYR